MGVFNYNELLERCMGKKELVGVLVKKFVEVLEDNLSSLRESIEAGDTEGVVQKAHSLKGSAANLAVEPIREPSMRLETMAREGSLDGAAECMEEIEKATAAFMEEGRAYLAENG